MEPVILDITIKKAAPFTNSLYPSEMHWRVEHLCLSLCLKCCITVLYSRSFLRFFCFAHPPHVPAATLGDTSGPKMEELSVTEGRCLVPTWIIWIFFERVNTEIIVQDVENCTEKCSEGGRQLLSRLMWQTLTVSGWPKQNHVTSCETRSASAQGQMRHNYAKTLALAFFFFSF